MKLTPEQLRQNAAAMAAFADGKKIQWQGNGSSHWYHTDSLCKIDQVPHRPKPEPVRRPWSKPDDVPANCWLRFFGNPGTHQLVTMVTDLGLVAGSALFDWSEIERQKGEYSTDRKTWRPCTVEEVA